MCVYPWVVGVNLRELSVLRILFFFFLAKEKAFKQINHII